MYEVWYGPHGFPERVTPFPTLPKETREEAEHFINGSPGQMGWKDVLPMFDFSVREVGEVVRLHARS
jgi:hypothetical protein